MTWYSIQCILKLPQLLQNFTFELFCFQFPISPVALSCFFSIIFQSGMIPPSQPLFFMTLTPLKSLVQLYCGTSHILDYLSLWLDFHGITDKCFSLVIIVGWLTWKLTNQYSSDSNSYYNLSSQTCKESEEESFSSSPCHSSRIFRNKYGAKKITGIYMFVNKCNLFGRFGEWIEW